MVTNNPNSHIFIGEVSHRRFTPKKHSFRYALFMMALDVDEMQQYKRPKGIFGFSWFHALRFFEKDYLKGEPGELNQRIKNKVISLGGNDDIVAITMLVQVRCFGLYFSPANFYFCYDDNNQCTQMLAEVSNTPWNERHYYLVDLQVNRPNEKVFHVSPFFDLNMHYHWRVNPPKRSDVTGKDSLFIHIENIRQSDDSNLKNKVFDASLMMKPKAFTSIELFKAWCKLPVMTLKVVVGIYWQALKLFIKKVPFVHHPKR